MGSYIDWIGFAAAIITNISFYPQAYEVHIICTNKDYDKLNAISLPTFSLTGFGCSLWLVYSYVLNITPMIFGSILTIVPSLYICTILIYWNYFLRGKNNIQQVANTV